MRCHYIFMLIRF